MSFSMVIGVLLSEDFTSQGLGKGRGVRLEVLTW